MALDLAVALLVAAVSSFVACRYMRFAAITDRPDLTRKMHVTPTPTSGGVGVALGLSLGLASLTLPPVRAWSDGLDPAEALHMAYAFIGALLFLAIGFLDDLRPMKAAPKFLVFATAAIIAPLIIGGPVNIPLGAGLVIPLHPVAAVLGAALWVFVLVNAVNFMDGANGLSMGAVAIGFVGLTINALLRDAPHAAALAVCGLGASLGFLYWNYPRGRLFAGDSGALFLGALAAATGLIVIEDGGASPFTVVLFFFPILADVLLTLAWRIGRRPQLLDGHRDHHYQIALRAGWPHRRVTAVFWGLSAGCVALATMGSVLGRGAWMPIEWRAGPLETIVSYTQFVLFVLLATVALIASNRIRAFAAAHGHDAP